MVVDYVLWWYHRWLRLIQCKNMHFSPILALKAPKRHFPQLYTFSCHLGAFKGRNSKEYMFSIKYSLSHLWWDGIQTLSKLQLLTSFWRAPTRDRIKRPTFSVKLTRIPGMFDKIFYFFKKYKWSSFLIWKNLLIPPFDLRQSTWSPPIFRSPPPPGKKWHFPKRLGLIG